MPSTPEPLYLSDFLLNSQMSQCALCGELVPDGELVDVELDVRGGWERVCGECRDGMEQA